MKNTNALLIILCFIAFITNNSYGQVNNISIGETCIFTNEGWIEVHLDSAELSSYNLPFILDWENITTGDYMKEIQIDDYEFTIDSLSAGQYEINIQLDKNCKILIDTTIVADSTNNLKISPRLFEPTCGHKDGLISVFVQGGSSPYNYSWSNRSSSYYINKLTPGEYCVTVTDQECGYGELCVTLDYSIPTIGIKNIEQITDCNPMNIPSCDGRIELTVEGISQFTITWLNSEGDTLGTGTSLGGICEPGEYLAHVAFSDKCSPLVYSVLVGCCNDSQSDLEVSLEPTFGCGDPNELDANVTGGVEPYVYQWNNFANASHIENLGNEEYFVTITDSLGCSVSDSFNFKFIEETDRVVPCKGLFDGEITFLINNSDNCQITISYDYSLCSDCDYLPVISGDTSSEIELTLTQLGGNIDYTFYVDVCDCYDIPFKFKLPEEDWEETYAGVEDLGDYTYKCIYNIDCKTNHADSGRYELATVDLNSDEIDCHGGLTDCGSVEYKCGDEVVGEKEIHHKVMRRGRAIQLALTLGYDPSLVYGTVGKEPNWCDWVSICPNDPTCVAGNAFGQFGGDQKALQYLGNGCWRVKCKILGLISSSYKICNLDYVPDYLFNYYDPSFSLHLNLSSDDCNPIERNVGQLTMFLDDLESVPDFFASELYAFLLQNEENPKRWCAKVRFCTSDYSIIWHTPWDEIECGAIDPPLSLGGFVGDIEYTCLPYTDEKSNLRVFCSNLCKDSRPGFTCPPQPVLILKNFTPSIYTFTGEDPPPQLLARYSSPTNFIRFSPARQNDSTWTVNGIYNSDDEMLYHSFSYDKWYPENSDNLEYMFQYFDNTYLMGIAKDTTASHKYQFVASFEDTLIRKPLECTSTLAFDKISSVDSIHIVTGNYTGTLSYNSSNISSSIGNPAFFIVNLDKNVGLNSIHKVLQNGWKIFSDEESGDLAFWSPSTTSLYIDNTLQTGISSSEIVTMNGISGSVSLRDINLVLNSNLKLMDYKRGKHSSDYIIAGTGRIALNGTQIYSTTTSKVVLLNMQNNGTVNWIKDYSLAAIDTSNIGIELTDHDEAYFSLSLIDDITINDSLLTNSGGSDIAIFGIDTSGTYINLYSYASPSDEIVSDMFYSNGALYLGGNLDADTYSRKIGILDFENYSANYGQAYTSYIVLKSDTLSPFSGSQELAARSLEKPTSDLRIIPNPAYDEIMVQMDKACEINDLVLLDITGKVKLAKRIPYNELRTGTTIDLTSIEPGFYIVNLTSKCGQNISESLILGLK